MERPTKVCPDCAETVLAEAKVCKHCGKRFEEDAEPSVVEEQDEPADVGVEEDGEATPSEPESETPPPAAQRKRRVTSKRVVVALVAIVLLGGGVTAVLLLSGSDGPVEAKEATGPFYRALQARASAGDEIGETDCTPGEVNDRFFCQADVDLAGQGSGVLYYEVKQDGDSCVLAEHRSGGEDLDTTAFDEVKACTD